MRRRLAIGTGAAAAVLAAGGGVAVLTWPSDPVPVALPESIASAPAAAGAKAAAATAEPTGVRIDRVPLTALGRKFTLPQRDTQRFSMVSVSWKSPADKPDGTVQVRTRDAGSGAWTGWKSLEVAEEAADLKGERAASRGAMEPLWTGPSNGVAARLVGSGTKPLPAELRLALIDPDAPEAGGRGGGEPVPAVPPASEAPPATTAPTQAATTKAGTTAPTPPMITKPVPEAATTTVPPTVPKPPLPAYVSRAKWGADESLVKAPPTIAKEGVKMVWVHHTGTEDNPVTCAEVPKFVKAIMANDIREKGLDDIGYNYLVDKCGTLYEGRKGGVTAAVVGAHVAGFNTGSTGVALIGDYTTERPANAALTTIAKLAASRLGAYGFDPTSTADMTAGVTGLKWPLGSTVTFPRIAGHSDGTETECPGAAFYPLMGQLRARAALPGLAITSVSGGEPTTGTYYVHDKGQVHFTVGGDGSKISRFDLLVDSKVVATAPGNTTAGSAPFTVTPGSHNAAVRVVHTTGATDITPVTKIIGDVMKPTFPIAPTVALRAGTYSDTAVPVAVSFKAADNNGKISRQRAVSPKDVPMLGTSTLWNATVKPNVAVAYSVRASDMAYNEGASVTTRTIVQMPENQAKRTGSWQTRSASTYLGGRASAGRDKNAKLAYTFNGRAAALTFTRTPATGQAIVLVDGVKVATVDTKGPATAHRQTIWVKALTAKTHTVSVVVVGTPGRPTVISDGLTYVK
ncbi:N-acetylmuramoyl-L-alanine amidase [Paractinoplanes maris]|uniref:N-acetylmuramoyl-L-alanine amidase n=1 Tax=Paractinoplanes maris TaxID=1734446 RepID=UPI002020A4DF|nr:N-acetylmuramoyl-L-alanine amidase [Actinoplanes maris]